MIMHNLPGILLLSGLLAVACDRPVAPGAAAAGGASEGSPAMINVRIIGPDGKLTGPVEQPKLVLSEEQWKQRLTPEQYQIVRSKGTERPFCGGLLDNKGPGIYACIACNLPLFEAETKFESGTGWPSFFRPVASENILEEVDQSHGMVRTEIMCKRCEGHLGHVFKDGPRPTGLRYCVNSESLRFVPAEQVGQIAEDVPSR
jgi:methionine-R-sulfoxide reductase